MSNSPDVVLSDALKKTSTDLVKAAREFAKVAASEGKVTAVTSIRVFLSELLLEVSKWKTP